MYLGDDTSIKIRYWQWPKWDKESIYFLSKNTITSKIYVKSRLFYDKFVNQLNAYDDNTYSSQTYKSSFTSYYDDYSYGANIEGGYQFNSDNLLKFIVSFKNDVHRENNEGEPQRTVSDYTMSYGIEDVYNITNKLKIIPGLSYNTRASIKAQEYNSSTDVVSDLPENNSSATNAQIALFWDLNNNAKFKFTVADKTRFATMKDRYSYKLGTALPNPDLLPESALNFDLESNIKVGKKFSLTPSVFYSHLNNTIQMVDDVEPGISQMQNTGESVFYGADLTLGYKLLGNLNFNLVYSYIERENKSNPDLKFTDVPNHNIFGYLDYKLLDKLNVILSSQYSSDRYSTSYGIVSPSFNIYNLNINYQILKNFGLKAGVNNIFDKNYTISEGYPEEGRNFYISVKYNYSK
ncbi:MAG: TonB-dependent receptor [Saprospiraceae bacterium]